MTVYELFENPSYTHIEVGKKLSKWGIVTTMIYAISVLCVKYRQNVHINFL